MCIDYGNVVPTMTSPCRLSKLNAEMDSRRERTVLVRSYTGVLEQRAEALKRCIHFEEQAPCRDDFLITHPPPPPPLTLLSANHTFQFSLQHRDWSRLGVQALG